MPNERLREILPLLRPRSAEPTLFTQAVFYLLCLGLAALVSLYAWRRYRLRQRHEREFLAQGEALGLDDEDLALVRRVARVRGLSHPGRLLTSSRAFDRHVGSYASGLARRDLNHPGLDHIAHLRRSLGFDQVPADQPLASTRQLERGQTLMVWEAWHEEAQHSPWLILDLDEGSLILVPLLRDDVEHEDLIEVGDELSIRFWREGDTEYRFRAVVVERDRGAGSCRLAHAHRVERMQQRDFFRIDVDFPVRLYALPEPGTGAEPGSDVADRAAEEAAVVLLDGHPMAAGDFVDADTASAEDASESRTAPPGLDLDQLASLDGQATDLSAGGMAMETPPGQILPPSRWMVDPEFTGAFPLAGVVCHLLGEEARGDRVRLKLRFEGLSGAAESEIVRQVYQHQLLEAGGRDAAGGGLPRPVPEDDSLPDVVDTESGAGPT